MTTDSANQIDNEVFKKLGNPAKIIDDLKKLSDIDHEELFDKHIDKLYSYSKDSFQSMNQSILYDMVEILTYTFYANYVNIDHTFSQNNLHSDKLHLESSPNFSVGIYTKTGWVIKLMIEYFQNPKLRLADLHIINSFTTGSITTDLVSKSFIWLLAFVVYYNYYIDSGLVTKNIRSDFKNKYHRYYKRRLPSLNSRIEIVIKGGTRQIDLEKELPVYALGALLHDIGKIPHISCHDGDMQTTEDKLKLHTLAGFKLLAHTKQYAFPVLAMTAFHHEYYDGKKSYNLTNSLIEKLFNRKRTDASILNFVSYDVKDFIDGSAFAFFPPKLMEIIDTYTELTAKERLSTAEALIIMKHEYIAYSLQLDPILFEIFLEFMCKCELLNNNEKAKVDEIIY